MSYLWILLGIVVIVGLGWVSIYNRLVKMSVWADESFSQVDVQLQRRNDLIPNLVETVKGYAKHESGTLEAVVKARQQLIDIAGTASAEEKNQLSNQLTGALSRLLAVAEAYPDLKANQNFINLQQSLEETENKIATARQLYNSAIGQYNALVQTVPNNFVAGVHHFTTKAYLQAPEEAKVVPKVSF